MRNVSLAFRVVALVAVFSVSVIGQQSPSINLPVEPASTPSVITLADAAGHNDFPLFDAMFNNASQREARAYAELHSFWKWSLTDPVGAFYGDELHAKFAAEYPGYADYIATYGIIDSHGRAFYPSSETRSFLLRQAVLGRSPLIASSGERAPRPHVTAVPAGTHTAKLTHNVKVARPAKVLPGRVVDRKPVVEAKPVVVTPAVLAPVVVAAPIVTPTTVAVVTPKVVAAARVVVAPKTIAARPASVASKPDARLGRGLLLILAGLIGLGMLSLMLHAPGEEPVAETQSQAHPLEPSRMIQLEQKPKKTA